MKSGLKVNASVYMIFGNLGSSECRDEKRTERSNIGASGVATKNVAVNAAMKSGLKVCSLWLLHKAFYCSSECRDEKRTESVSLACRIY